MKIVQITSEMRDRCLNFSEKIIDGNDQFNRLNNTVPIRIERTFVGKLAELVFLEYLNLNGLNIEENDMFEVYEGQTAVDNADFFTSNRDTIDVKCASKPFHQKIMVPIDQFENIPKDYYVGIKLNSRLANDNTIIIDSITEGKIYGFCTYNDLANSPTGNFGEGPCKYRNLNMLYPIEKLLALMK